MEHTKHQNKLDFFASQAMIAVMQETQETVPASTWDFIKFHLRQFGLTFLVVQYKDIDGVYAGAAKRAYLYADAMAKESAEYYNFEEA